MAERRTPDAEATKATAKSDFRRTLGQFPTGVTVVTTTDDQNRPVGMTANSFNSVSQEPPLILWSVDKNALSAQTFSQAKHFAVNILGKHQTEIANNFAAKGADKFADVPFKKGRDGCPILKDLAACLECKTWSVYEGGDHLIIVGEVLDYHCYDHVVPLVFAQSSYAVPVQNPAETRRGATQALEQGFLEHHLLYQLWSVYALYSSDLYQLLLEQCGVIPEEWRVLTLLLDRGGLAMQNIAQTASQPLDHCRNTLTRMQASGYLTVQDDDLVQITKKGTALAERLVLTANQHEAKITNSLTSDRKTQLKQDLTEVLTTLRQSLKLKV